MTGEVRRNKSCFYRLFRDEAIQTFSSSRIFEAKSTRTLEIAEITEIWKIIYQLNMEKDETEIIKTRRLKEKANNY